MSKNFIKFFIMVLLLAPQSGQAAVDLSASLKGRILLQVEARGEAWYINPENGKRIYLKNGPTAYNLMKSLGLGVTDADLKKIPVGAESRFMETDADQDGLSDNLEEGLKTDPENADTDSDGVSDGQEVLIKNTDPLGLGKLTYDNTLINRLKGKILLQVQARGQAWYLSPVNGKRYYLRDGNAAYQIMKYLSLGIKNSDLNTITTDPLSNLITTEEENAAAESPAPENSDSSAQEASAPVAETNNQASTDTSSADNSLASQTLTNAEIISKLKPSVVYLETAEGSGTGFIIEADGYILTNAHVVAGVSNLTAKLYDSRSYTAMVVGRDEIKDTAVLKISESGLTAAELGDSDAVAQGDPVFAFGYPFGIEGDVSFKDGTISRRHTIDEIVYFETSVDIHPGNSGGPLVDKYGRVIGINTSAYGFSVGGVAIGESIKFALPINTAKDILPNLKNGISVYANGSSVSNQINVELVPQTINSSLVILGAQGIVMMKLKFTSVSDQELKVTGITFKREGLFDSSEFSSVYITKDGIKIGDGSSVNDKIVFNNLPLEIPANSSKEIILNASIAYDVTNYFHTTTLVIESAASFVTTGTINGDFPMKSREVFILE